tara:strand:- start:44 stop:1354 length:1311 start_codon:yes stop_codon:yes gene_type:complete
MEIKIVDGAIRLPDTIKNREEVKKFLRKLIDDKGLKVKGSGKPSKNFKEFPKVYFDGELTEFRNKAGTGDLSTNKFEWGNKPARDSEKLNRKLNTASVDKVTAKDWEQKHITDWNKKDNPTGKPIKDTHPQFRRLEHRIKAADIFWKSEAAKDLSFKAGDVENLIYTNPSQWKLKDAGEQTYGRNFVFDIDKNTGEIIYTPRSKFTGYDFKYAKPFKGNIPLEELTKEANYAHEQFGITPKKSFDQGRIRWNSKYSRFLMGAGFYSLLNTDSVEAASSMLSTGVNKADTVQFAKGIGKDIAGQLTWAAAAKGLGGNGLGYISPYAMKLAPIMLGYQAKILGDAVLQGAIGEDLKSQGEIAEAAKQYRKANGWSNGKSDRQNARHSTGLKANREMIDDYNLVKAQGDDETESSLVEFQENYRFNQAMNKSMRETKAT